MAADGEVRTVWVAQGDCGDYYCEGEHLLGVFTGEEAAKLSGQAYVSVDRLRQFSVGERTLDEDLSSGEVGR